MADRRVIELVEYKPVELPVGELPMKAAALLHDRYSKHVHIERVFWDGGDRWRLTNLGWAGYIPLDETLAIALMPKTSISRLFEMLEVAYDLSIFEQGNDLYEVAGVDDLYERLAGELARRVLLRLRRGIYRSYVAQEEQSRYVRGRLDVRRQMAQPWRVDPHCHFEEHTADLEENQLLLWSLQQILRSGLCHEERALPSVRKAYHALLGVTTPTPLSAQACRNRLYNRLNQDYQPLHALAYFFLAHTGPTHEAGDRRMIPFLVDMAGLFEFFVAAWLRKFLPSPFRVSVQENYHLGRASDTKFIIDLVIRNGDEVWVLDTKYKVPEKAATSDIAQIVAYAESMETNEGILIYPQRLPGAARYQVGGTAVRILAFDLEGDLNVAGERFVAELLHGVW